MPLSNFTAYIETLSAYRTLLSKNQPDPLPKLISALLECLESHDLNHPVEVEYVYFTISYSKTE